MAGKEPRSDAGTPRRVSSRRLRQGRRSPTAKRSTRPCVLAGSTACGSASTLTSYTVRFTPRIARTASGASSTPTRMNELIELGRAHSAGLKVFQQRDKKKSRLYSYEVRNCQFDAEYARQFRANRKAWEFYQAQAPWYRRVSCYWVMSAKREETRLRRLAHAHRRLSQRAQDQATHFRIRRNRSSLSQNG